MSKSGLTAFILTGFCLVGCAGLGGSRETVTPVSAAGEEGVILGPLAEPGLPRGGCGMVLWTLDENRPAPVFRYISGKQGEIVIAGVSKQLFLQSADGASEYGVFEKLVFSEPEGLRVSVSVNFSLGFDGGAYLERGLIAVENDQGWRTVTPAAGLAGCRR